MKINITIKHDEEHQAALAAVPLSLARPLMAGWDKTRYADVFNKYGEGKGKQKYRIYIPLNAHEIQKPKPIVVPPGILTFLRDAKMTLDNYLVGTVILPDGKRTTRLGKVLARIPELKHQFDNDPQRRATKSVTSWVVISRHPYDIVGMSFDRGWTSCMNVEDGSNRKHLKAEVKNGSLVAYLVKANDKNINAPSARLIMKPFRKEGTSHSILVPEGEVYGTAPDTFEHIVATFCRYMNSGSPEGKYKLAAGSYNDNLAGMAIHVTDQSDVLALSKSEQMILANASSTTPEVLDKLSRSNISAVAEAVAENISTYESTLEFLTRHSSLGVREEAAKNTMMPSKVLLQMAIENKDEPGMVLRRIAGNKSLEPAHRREIVEHHLTAGMVMAFAASPRSDPETLLACYNSKFFTSTVAEGMAKNPDTPEALLTNLFNNVKGFKKADQKNIAMLASENPNLPVELAIKIATAAKPSSEDIERMAFTQGGRSEVLDMLIAEKADNESCEYFLKNHDRVATSALLKIIQRFGNSDNDNLGRYAVGNRSFNTACMKAFLDADHIDQISEMLDNMPDPVVEAPGAALALAQYGARHVDDYVIDHISQRLAEIRDLDTAAKELMYTIPDFYQRRAAQDWIPIDEQVRIKDWAIARLQKGEDEDDYDDSEDENADQALRNLLQKSKVPEIQLEAFKWLPFYKSSNVLWQNPALTHEIVDQLMSMTTTGLMLMVEQKSAPVYFLRRILAERTEKGLHKRALAQLKKRGETA